MRTREKIGSARIGAGSLVLTLLVALVAGVMAHPARAEVEVRASVDRSRITLDDQLSLRVEVRGSFRGGGEPNIPELEGWFVYSSGSSSNFSFMNGRIESSRVFDYVLVPQSEGTFTIGPVTVEIQGKEYASDPITVEVTAGTGAPEPPPGGAPPPPRGEEPGRPRGRGDEVFVTAEVDRDTVYVGEEIVWTFDFYRRIQVLGNADYRPPSATNFWVEDLPPQRTFYRNRSRWQYHVTELKQAFFPTSPGRQTIGPAKLTVTVDDFFDRDISDFFRRGYTGFGRQVELRTDPIEVLVLPLPSRGRPDDFEGTVGRRFEFAVRADETQGVVGDPITLTVRVEGRGNLRTVAPPGLPPMPGVRVIESGSSTDLQKKGYRVRGVKKYEYILIPQQKGHLVVPSFRFSYFDTEQRAYTTLHSDPIEIEISPAPDESDRSLVLVGGQEDIRVVGQDIRHIKTSAEHLDEIEGPLYLNPLFLALQPLPLLVLVGGIFLRGRRERLASDRAYARLARSGKVARRNLAQARRHLDGDPAEFLGALARATYGFLGDRLDVPTAGITRDQIAPLLGARGVDGERVAGVLDLLDRLDTARFAPGDLDREGKLELMGRVEEAIASLGDLRNRTRRLIGRRR